MEKIKDIFTKVISWLKEPGKLYYRIASLVLVLIMIGSGGYIAMQFIFDAKSGKEFEDLQNMVNNNQGTGENDEAGEDTSDDNSSNSSEDYTDSFKDTEEGTGDVEAKYEAYYVNGEEILVPVKNLDWDALHEKNGDIYAWLCVPGTIVDYPVLQHPTENDYYLHKDLNGEFSWDGNIYSQVEYNSKDWTDYHTILYGHNRRSNGKMFRSLHNFEDSYFFKMYKYVFVYTEEGVYIYEVYAAYETGSEHQLATYPTDSYEALKNYIQMCKGRAEENGYFREISEDEHLKRILTMQTCVGDDNTVRYVVQSYLIYDPTQEQ